MYSCRLHNKTPLTIGRSIILKGGNSLLLFDYGLYYDFHDQTIHLFWPSLEIGWLDAQKLFHSFFKAERVLRKRKIKKNH